MQLLALKRVVPVATVLEFQRLPLRIGINWTSMASKKGAIVYPDDLEVRLVENRLENNRQDVRREPAEYANPTVDASE